MISLRNLLSWIAIIHPPARLKCSEWADKFAYIPPEGNAEPGKFRLSRMPHEEAMLDDPFDPNVREVYWMLASQAGGKTLCVTLICEYVIHQLKKSIIMVRATKETALEWMRDKFMTAVNATKCMDGVLLDPRTKDSGSTALNRKFSGGSIKVIGAKSPAAFRGSSAGDVYQDEIDAYEISKEGDPCALADRAAITFADSRKIKCSTPTLAGFSRIAEGYERGDKQKYFLPCPVCFHFQDLRFKQLKFSFTKDEYERTNLEMYHPNNWEWELFDETAEKRSEKLIRDTRKAIYVCESCKRGWTDSQRIQSYKSGSRDNDSVNGLRAEWRSTAAFNGIRSRHMNGMYLTIGLEKGFENYLHQFAENFLKAVAGGRETLMAWTNMFDGLPFYESQERTDWKDVKNKAEEYAGVPVEVMWIGFAMDVHPNRVEIFWGGFGIDNEFWGLDYQVMYGDFDMPDMQSRVEDELLGKRFEHPVLGPMKLQAGAIDCGHQTKVKAVHRFCGKHRVNNIWSIKGFDQYLGSIYTSKTERTFQGLAVSVNTDHFKNAIFDSLKKKETSGARVIHFPTEKCNERFNDKFYMMLCSEVKQLMRDKKTGFGHYRWVKPTSSTRNEALDCMVYLFCVFDMCRAHAQIARQWKEVQEKMPKQEPKPETIEPQKEEKLPELKKIDTSVRKPMFRRRVRINSPFARGW